MQRLRLNERVAIAFATHLTWADGLPARPSARGAPGPAPAAPAAGGGALAALQSGAREWAARASEALPGLGGGRSGGPADDFAGTINVRARLLHARTARAGCRHGACVRRRGAQGRASG